MIGAAYTCRRCRLSSVGQSDALVMRRSTVRFRQAARNRSPGQRPGLRRFPRSATPRPVVRVLKWSSSRAATAASSRSQRVQVVTEQAPVHVQRHRRRGGPEHPLTSGLRPERGPPQRSAEDPLAGQHKGYQPPRTGQGRSAGEALYLVPVRGGWTVWRLPDERIRSATKKPHDGVAKQSVRVARPKVRVGELGTGTGMASTSAGAQDPLLGSGGASCEELPESVQRGLGLVEHLLGVCWAEPFGDCANEHRITEDGRPSVTRLSLPRIEGTASHVLPSPKNCGEPG
jgi:hypothetical protein